MAEAMRKLRSDATRLGLGPFSQWRQLTSGRGLTLVHFPAQLEPFLTHNTP